MVALQALKDARNRGSPPTDRLRKVNVAACNVRAAACACTCSYLHRKRLQTLQKAFFKPLTGHGRRYIANFWWRCAKINRACLRLEGY